jgi:Nitrogen permease regulator 2
MSTVDATTPLLRAILFAEFHNTLGPQIAFQVPLDFMSSRLFDSISDYVITKPLLSDKLTTVRAHSLAVLGLPVCLEDPIYPRNALLFNLAFVFDERTDRGTLASFADVLRKCSALLRTLELESGFLRSAETRNTLPRIIEQLYVELNGERRESVVVVDAVNTLRVKLFPRIGDESSLASVCDHHVPIAADDTLDRLVRSPDCDLTMHRIAPLIDGINHAHRIAVLSGVHASLVRKCVSNLVALDAVRLVDMFAYSNVYMASPDIVHLYAQRLQRRRRREHSCGGGGSGGGGDDGVHRRHRRQDTATTTTTTTAATTATMERAATTERHLDAGDGAEQHVDDADELASADELPAYCHCCDYVSASVPFSAIFRLYCALGSGATLSSFVAKHRFHELGIDARRFIIFGVLNGFIRRVRPYVMARFSAAASLYDADDSAEHRAIIAHIADAQRPMLYDQLCLRHGKPAVDQFLAHHHSRFVIFHNHCLISQ